MSLARKITDLAARIGQEMKNLVTPDHPGVAKAWANFGVVKGAVIVRASFNVESVTRIATGKYRVTFTTPFQDANYCWLAFARNAGSQSSMKVATARASAEAKTPAYVELICTTAAGTLADSSEINLTVFR